MLYTGEETLEIFGSGSTGTSCGRYQEEGNWNQHV
jgi:hypothetical protein